MSEVSSGAAAKPARKFLKYAGSAFGNGPEARILKSTAFPNTILDEPEFRDALRLERKRSDRTGRRFVLMLLETSALRAARPDAETCQRFIAELVRMTRETDVKGWYLQSCIFGLIFTEIGDGEAGSVTAALKKKMTHALSATLGAGELNGLDPSFHVYPEDVPPLQRCERQPDPTLYPDQNPALDPKRLARGIKRALDVGGGLCAILMLAPLLLVIALAIKSTSAGPVLFRQRRVGRFGAVFTFLKFRSMYVTSDDAIHKSYVRRFITERLDSSGSAMQKTVFKITADPRVTPVGRWLRRSSLDELPQLFNVLRGDMSLVGPRPPVLYEVECYKQWHTRRLMTVKPGITGLWQVSGRSRVTFNEMVRLDLEYAANWSLWLDLLILFRTPAAVLSGDGAY